MDLLLSPGPLRVALDAIEEGDPFGVPLDTVVREVLSLAAAHSKSTVPAAALSDRVALVRLMRRIVFTPMRAHRAAVLGSVSTDEQPGPEQGRGVPHPFPDDAYSWLTAADGPKADLADDVVDAVRVLRAADVLRQRGTALRTSGGFEVYFDGRTGHAVCTLRPADGRAAYVVTYDDHRGAGEANIRMAVVTPRGDLRIAFHRGQFLDDPARHRAAESVANAILDIQSDVLPSFVGVTSRGLPPPTRTALDMQIQLERPDDDAGFAELVRDVLCAEDPDLATRVDVVEATPPDPVQAAEAAEAASAERRRFDLAEPVDPWGALADEVVRRVGEHGTDLTGIDRVTVFRDVCRATVRSGEVLVEEGSPPDFVYVPLGDGLRVRPLGGYPAAPMHPWVPVGTTGAVRRSGRNSRVVAERDVDVLVVPGRAYVLSWLRPVGPEDLRVLLGAGAT